MTEEELAFTHRFKGTLFPSAGRLCRVVLEGESLFVLFPEPLLRLSKALLQCRECGNVGLCVKD
ncbi:hypothetical protein NQZ68_031666 [Dissostichus eleginoides]|nr:hypothetical protein NQZ68_031666 [Dissostichus eleginoides]